MDKAYETTAPCEKEEKINKLGPVISSGFCLKLYSSAQFKQRKAVFSGQGNKNKVQAGWKAGICRADYHKR